ncbi:hypothetical protein TWF281_008981 [Arthrobotrys megalospora]
MYAHPAHHPAYQPYHLPPPPPPFPRPPPGLNVASEIQPPPGIPPPQPQNPPTTQLENNQRQVQTIIDAMNQETEQLKRDKNYQSILLAHGLLYTACPDAWITCNCEFCVGVRHVRQYDGLDAIGQRLWNDPQYSFWREYPNAHGLKECKCDRCTGKGQIKIPDNLAPDWNLWYGDGGDGTSTEQDSVTGSAGEYQPKTKPPKFTEKPTNAQGNGANVMLKSNLPHGTEKPLFEILDTNIQKCHNQFGPVMSNSTSSNGACHPCCQPIKVEPFPLPDPGSSVSSQSGSTGQPYANGIKRFNIRGKDGINHRRVPF